jgi:hypothetical protein
MGSGGNRLTPGWQGNVRFCAGRTAGRDHAAIGSHIGRAPNGNLDLIFLAQEVCGSNHGKIAVTVVQQHFDEPRIQVGGNDEVKIAVAVHVADRHTQPAARPDDTDGRLRTRAQSDPDGVVSVAPSLPLGFHESQVWYAITVKVSKDKTRTAVVRSIWEEGGVTKNGVMEYRAEEYAAYTKKKCGQSKRGRGFFIGYFHCKQRDSA